MSSFSADGMANLSGGHTPDILPSPRPTIMKKRGAASERQQSEQQVSARYSDVYWNAAPANVALAADRAVLAQHNFSRASL